MATVRIYVPSSASYDASGDSIVTGFTDASGWTAVAPGSTEEYRYGWADIPNIGKMPPGDTSLPVTGEVSFTFSTGAFASSAYRWGMRVVLGPLAAGATITGSQTLTGAMMCRTGTFVNTCRLAQALQIRSEDNTLQKTVEAAGSDWEDGTTWNTSVTTRWDQATSAATDYDIQAGDYLIWELGTFNDFLDSESRIFALASGQASDITSTDSTSTRNPFLEITYTGTLAIQSDGVSSLMLLGVGT